MPRSSFAARNTFPTSPRTGRRERRRNETRNRLYKAALQLFAERGFLETTVEDITEAADVGKGTFFNYFPTKEHILAEFGGERTAAVERALERARLTKGSVLAVLRELATNAAGQSKESPALLRSIYSAHASCTAVRKELQKRANVTRNMLAEIFSIAQKRGEIRRDVAPADLARLVQIVFMGVTMSWAINPNASLRKTAEGVWDLMTINSLSGVTRENHRHRREH